AEPVAPGPSAPRSAARGAVGDERAVAERGSASHSGDAAAPGVTAVAARLAGASLGHVASERAAAQDQGRSIRDGEQDPVAERNGAANTGAAGAGVCGREWGLGPGAGDRLIARERRALDPCGRAKDYVDAAAAAVAAWLTAAAGAAHSLVVGKRGIRDGRRPARQVQNAAA